MAGMRVIAMASLVMMGEVEGDHPGAERIISQRERVAATKMAGRIISRVMAAVVSGWWW